MLLPGLGPADISPLPLVLLQPMKEKLWRCNQAGINFT